MHRRDTLAYLPIAHRDLPHRYRPASLRYPARSEAYGPSSLSSALGILRLRIPVPLVRVPLTRSPSFSDPMRVAPQNALSEANSQALQRSSSMTASSGTPSPLSAGPHVYSQKPPLPNQTQVVVHSRREHLAHLMRRERSLPRRCICNVCSPHRVSQLDPSINQPQGNDIHLRSGNFLLRDKVESLTSEMEEVRFSYMTSFPYANPGL